MDRRRWERIQELFHDAAELPDAERRARLEARCADDPSLVDDVLALLAEDAREDSPLDRDLAQVAAAALADPGASPAPREFGPYRLIRLLGEGGMGVVYLAERTDLGSFVAIKILRDAWLSPARRARFASEQRTLAQLNHPCIARLYDADALPDGTPWFAMEYVDGVPITAHCEARVRSIRATLELFRSVCEAVLHAHQLAVLHRDLKPSNILVTRGGQPKLLDFGIAKPLEDLTTGAGPTRTRTELRLMTPAYAAPEQIRGERLGAHTDIYSLGSILYELLTGGPPFDLADCTPAEVDRIITGREPERPSAAARRNAERSERIRAMVAERGAAWSDLDVLCLAAMQKDPARRYRTVDSLIRDIDHYLKREPLEARPDTMGYRAGKFVRRNWRPLSAAVAVLALGIGLVTFYTVRLARARNAAVAEAGRTRRIQEFMNGLFEGGDPEAGPADSLRVVSLLERGVRDARNLAGDPAAQAELYQTLGGIYHMLGELGSADSMLRASLDQRRAVLGPDHPDVARSMLELGLLRADQSRFDEAERLVREGLALSQRRASSDPAAVARATTALGNVLEDRGEYDQAIEVLTRAARLDSTARLPAADLSATLTELANCQFYAGHYAESDSLNRRLLVMDRKLFGERHPHVASDLVNLGAVQQEWAHWAEAERYYRQALEIYRGWYGENHYETASTLTMVGRTLVPQNRPDEARALLHRALEIRERIYGPHHPNVATTLNELGLLAQHEGRLSDAEADFTREIEIYRAAYGDKHYLIGLAYSNRGGAYLELKNYRAAERDFREALRRYAQTLPAGHLYLGITGLKLGRLLLRQDRIAEAQKETLAGYRIVSSQPEPPANFLRNALQDLIAESQTLKQPQQAATYQAELKRVESVTPAR